MKILTREEFCKTPNGTIYCELEKNTYFKGNPNPELPLRDMAIIGDLRIKTGYYERHEKNDKPTWNGAVDVLPNVLLVNDKNGVCNWCTWDDAEADYLEDTLFGVFEPMELMHMIAVLLCGVNKFSHDKLPDQDSWVIDNHIIPEEVIFKAMGVETTEDGMPVGGYSAIGYNDGLHELICDFYKKLHDKGIDLDKYLKDEEEKEE